MKGISFEEVIGFLEEEIEYQRSIQPELHRKAFDHNPADNEPVELSHYRYGGCVGTRIFCEGLLELIRGDEA